MYKETKKQEIEKIQKEDDLERKKLEVYFRGLTPAEQEDSYIESVLNERFWADKQTREQIMICKFVYDLDKGLSFHFFDKLTERKMLEALKLVYVQLKDFKEKMKID